MNAVVNLSRRHFLKGSAAAGGGLVLGFYGAPGKLASAQERERGRLNGYIHIATDNTVSITLTRAEMGQGVQTALPMIVAEELEADWRKIKVIMADAMTDGGIEPAAPGTGGSRSVREDFEGLAIAGATAREMLRQSAANRWGVPVGQCTARDGEIQHFNGQSLPYGELAGGAAFIRLQERVRLKDKSEWTLLGKDTRRLDAEEKVRGTAVFGTDVQVEGLLTGTIRQCPVWGGRLVSVDPAPAMEIRGVRKVVTTEDAVIVVGEGYWPAKKGLDALSPEWDLGPNAGRNSKTIDQQMRSALESPAAVAVDRGRIQQAKEAVGTFVDATYEVPFLHHATMEPMNATAHVHPDGFIEVWAPMQSAGRARHAIAAEFGVPKEKVNIHPTYMGGAFGRRIGLGFIRPAIIASQQTGRPVKVIWSREEDMAHPMLRPTSYTRMRAGLNQLGWPVVWEQRLVTPSISEQLAPERVKGELDPLSYFGAETLHYNIAHQRLEYAKPDTGMPLGFWRSVPHSYNGFFIEAFMDEIAVAGDKDPVALRREIMTGFPRHLEVLNTLSDAVAWTAGPPSGRHRGIAMHESFGSIVGQVVELSMPAEDQIRLEKITAVVDCGKAINPLTIKAQIEGSIIFALTAAMYGKIDVKEGRVVQQNFPDYEMVKLSQVPPVEVLILENGELGGIGEPGVPPLAPALTSALFRATGKRYRKLPLADEGLSLV
ncbi:MAG: molybdopterin cofactor-binding domain-containing protein [Alphaproteobacteria bacterium]|nr:molybdopterin cofactor-binding domain-containing protein [Alphaproteobacteria bacterium]